MTTMMEYAMVRLAYRGLSAKFDPSAPAVAPTRFERLQARLRTLL
jgi:hypothetical protein